MANVEAKLRELQRLRKQRNALTQKFLTINRSYNTALKKANALARSAPADAKAYMKKVVAPIEKRWAKADSIQYKNLTQIKSIVSQISPQLKRHYKGRKVPSNTAQLILSAVFNVGE